MGNSWCLLVWVVLAGAWGLECPFSAGGSISSVAGAPCVACLTLVKRDAGGKTRRPLGCVRNPGLHDVCACRATRVVHASTSAVVKHCCCYEDHCIADDEQILTAALATNAAPASVLPHAALFAFAFALILL